MNFEEIKKLNKKDKWETTKEFMGSLLCVVAIAGFVYLLILVAGAEYANLNQ